MDTSQLPLHPYSLSVMQKKKNTLVADSQDVPALQQEIQRLAKPIEELKQPRE